jgi:hypothetical protein
MPREAHVAWGVRRRNVCVHKQAVLRAAAERISASARAIAKLSVYGPVASVCQRTTILRVREAQKCSEESLACRGQENRGLSERHFCGSRLKLLSRLYG